MAELLLLFGIDQLKLPRLEADEKATDFFQDGPTNGRPTLQEHPLSSGFCVV